MIEVNATYVIACIMAVIVLVGFGFWLRGLLMASKDDHDFMGCVHPTCQRRQTPYELLDKKQLIILKRLYPGYIKRCDKEEGMRVEGKPPKTAIEPKEPGDTPCLCDTCMRAEGCPAAISGDRFTECENFIDEAEKEEQSKGTKIDEMA